MRPQSIWILVVLIVLATSAFGVGAALEKATPGTNETAVHQEGGGTESPASNETTPASNETVLGINPESTPLIVSALVGSAIVALGVWLYWRRSVVLWIAALTMAAFAVLDLVEVVHQVSVRHSTLVVIAAIVTLLHAVGALLAVRLATAGPSIAPQPAL